MTASLMISGLVLKYRKGLRWVMPRRVAGPLLGSTQVPLTVPVEVLQRQFSQPERQAIARHMERFEPQCARWRLDRGAPAAIPSISRDGPAAGADQK
jgi:hypothetical protein